jgi:integrase
LLLEGLRDLELLPRLRLGVLIGGGLVELLALRVGQDVAVALKEPEMCPGQDPVGAPGEWIDPRLGQKTLRQWVEEFESSRVDLEATTLAQHAACLRNHLLPWFGKKRLASIMEMQVRGFVTELVKQGLAPSTVTKSLRILSQILKAAVRNRLIPSNPCEGVKGPGEAPVEETIFLGPEEVNAVANAVGERYGPMVLLAGYPGLRFGELAGLRPHRIRFLRGRLEVVEVLKETWNGHYFGPPKYGRVRSVPLPPELAGYLAKFPPKHDLVFMSPERSMLRRSNFNRRAWAPAVWPGWILA